MSGAEPPSQAGLPTSLFDRDGGRFVPSPICGGPWDPRAMHGGPPTTLVGRAIADHGDGQEAWWLSRLTVELVKPVPLLPLSVEVDVIRPGRRVEVLDAVVLAPDGEAVVRGRGVRLRRQPGVVGDAELPVGPPPTVAHPHECAVFHHDYERPLGTFYMDAFELRTVDGRSFGVPGSSQCWSRLLVPVFGGEVTGPLDRVLACSDFGNGVSNILPPMTHTYINPDVTLLLHRLPHNEWVLMDAVTFGADDGYGTATNVLADDFGRLGVANQSLLLAAR